MGRNGYYIRKKPEVKCINPDHFEYFRTKSFCPCTDKDWECDNGYERDSGSVVCTAQAGFTAVTDPPAVCDAYYPVTRGYRKVSDNFCQGGVDHSPVYVRCPGSWGIFAAIGWFLWKVAPC